MEYLIFDTHAHYSARAFDVGPLCPAGQLPGKGWWACASRPPIRAMHPRCWSWPTDIPGCTPLSASIRRACWPRRIAVRKAPPLLFRYTAATGPQRCVPCPLLRGPQGGGCGGVRTGLPLARAKDAQLALFEAEIRLALELDKPIIVHDRSAHADVYALLKKYRPKGIVHCYSGSADDALWLAEQALHRLWRGLHLQGGQAGRQGHCRPAAGTHRSGNRLPLYGPGACPRHPLRQFPHPLCGEYIASIKGEEPEQVFRQTVENACQVYNLSV